MIPVVEQFKPYHQKAVKDFVVEAWKEFGFTYMPEYDSDLDDPEGFYQKQGGMFYLLNENNKIIGTIGIINKGEGIAELKRFYVDTNHRQKGCGTQLFNEALEFCKKNRFKKIEFETGKAFTKGHAFYQKRDFKIVREDEESYYMEKNLS